jgi:hypothetical protein
MQQFEQHGYAIARENPNFRVRTPIGVLVCETTLKSWAVSWAQQGF